MKKALSGLRKKMYSVLEFEDTMSDEIYDEIISNAWIILPAGGQGLRLRDITGPDVNKNAVLLNDNLTVIERVVLMYKNAGIKNFLVLVYHGADSVKEVLGDGSDFGVNVKYSYDPGRAVGRGGAILNALISGVLPADVYGICHNPVDQIVDHPFFVKEVIKKHWHAAQSGALASVVVTKETPYSFTGMRIADGLVKEIEMYPMVPVPAHVGVTVFSPEVYEYFHKLFNLEEKVDFESRLFPLLTEEGRLSAIGIDYQQWIPIKTNKHLQLLRDKITEVVMDSFKNIDGNNDYYSLFTDGGSKGNPGPAAIGGVIYDSLLNTVDTFKGYIGETTNNQAEYKALERGLELALELDIKNIQINMDSELVVKQILGEYQVKNEALKIINKSVLDLLTKFSNFEIKHVRREFNKVADALVNEAIKDQKL